MIVMLWLAKQAIRGCWVSLLREFFRNLNLAALSLSLSVSRSVHPPFVAAFPAVVGLRLLLRGAEMQELQFRILFCESTEP